MKRLIHLKYNNEPLEKESWSFQELKQAVKEIINKVKENPIWRGEHGIDLISEFSDINTKVEFCIIKRLPEFIAVPIIVDAPLFFVKGQSVIIYETILFYIQDLKHWEDYKKEKKND